VNVIFKALADPTRRRILELLKSGPKGSGEIA
jgi:DNA-binding transcriptional ArsR family regulator